jgi:pimeloyl-ACP methyl ester carboxylesterase
VGEVAAPIVLVHGAGCGGWCWDLVVPVLRERGHSVYAASLSGLDDPETGLERHGADVVEILEEDDLHDVLLVGHSYGGMPITVAAERAPERLGRLVYLDAFAPRDGESALDTRPDLAPTFRSWARDGLLPPIPPEFAGVETEEQAQLLRERLLTTPMRCLEEKVSLRSPDAARLPRTYVLCRASSFGKVASRARADGWDYREIDTAHMAMLTRPAELSELLSGLAQR